MGAERNLLRVIYLTTRCGSLTVVGGQGRSLGLAHKVQKPASVPATIVCSYLVASFWGVVRYSQESRTMYGELIPHGGGDPIPLLKKQLLIGRRESCDIVLRFANVSAHHCQLLINNGYWYIRDMQSRNGVKVNGLKVQERRIDPGDALSISKHKYELQYSPANLGAIGPPPADDVPAEIMGESLLTRAGLKSTAPEERPEKRKRSNDYKSVKRYDVLDDSAGQIDLPDTPL